MALRKKLILAEEDPTMQESHEMWKGKSWTYQKKEANPITNW